MGRRVLQPLCWGCGEQWRKKEFQESHLGHLMGRGEAFFVDGKGTGCFVRGHVLEAFSRESSKGGVSTGETGGKRIVSRFKVGTHRPRCNGFLSSSHPAPKSPRLPREDKVGHIFWLAFLSAHPSLYEGTDCAFPPGTCSHLFGAEEGAS